MERKEGRRYCVYDRKWGVEVRKIHQRAQGVAVKISGPTLRNLNLLPSLQTQTVGLAVAMQ